MSNTEMLGPWLRRFLLEYLVSERNLALNTQRSYRDMLVVLLPFMAKNLTKPVDQLRVLDLSPKLVRAFLSHLEEKRHCGTGTRNQRLGALHALARFVGEHSPEHIGWCAQIRAIPYKKASQATIGYLEKQEMEALLNAPDRQTAQGRRDYALLMFLYNSGARASEAASLRIRDLDSYRKCACITGKGGKQRICPLWPATFNLLDPLIVDRDPVEPVFLNRYGKSITRFGIHTLIERYALRAREQAPSLASKRVSPHLIRHTTATHLLRAGVDINTIRGWLGHASLNTTNVYAEIDLETKARALASCAPTTQRARKSWRSQPTLMDFLRSL
ncbi:MULTISPECIES: tyrosine-type recombinase/integrase [unclassified Caballeronia]|uniref:tyrosine-type recombinase/integrase n=1 Tax=unclassified Caballeronia TaxID=2646786 RepID=UPI00286522C2|nr:MULTISPECIES: tyrosine-type recombinase/integrase [unclassified Caballeronia]MDR5777396.1 tyrosine-type recombinase/integrase [Caballeronia sp. LZ002]MDR5852826.1 tyrosine-type recombinase/integrase [Caballeronia sp. LZ003]